MQRRFLKFAIDVVLFLCAMGLLLTGLLLAYILPPGSGRWQVWGITRHEWGDVHFWIAMVMLGAAVLHVLLNWSWVCMVAAGLFRRDTNAPRPTTCYAAGAGLILLVVLTVAAFLVLANHAKSRPETGRQEERLRFGQ